jgi:hypothetical protein
MTELPLLRHHTDEQVTRATGLHVDNLRRLITWGAVQPISAGGGRGRVREWTTRQALRISITAQFVEAGFSLQMAHTLTYCLPLDDLLYLYDPKYLMEVMAQEKPDESERRLLRQLTHAEPPGAWPERDYMGSQTLIVDGKFLYSDVLGDCPTLMAVIDRERQRVYPTRTPMEFLHGTGVAEKYKFPRVPDAQSINPESLLIDAEFLKRRKTWKALPKAILPEQIVYQIDGGVESVVCRTLLAINFALGMVVCVRKLNDLPTHYYPYEVYDD